MHFPGNNSHALSSVVEGRAVDVVLGPPALAEPSSSLTSLEPNGMKSFIGFLYGPGSVAAGQVARAVGQVRGGGGGGGG